MLAVIKEYQMQQLCCKVSYRLVEEQAKQASSTKGIAQKCCLNLASETHRTKERTYMTAPKEDTQVEVVHLHTNHNSEC